MDRLPLDEFRDRLVARTRDKRFVLIGEASHGTHDFYAERAQITRRLIEAHRVGAVTWEADWPDADRVNRYVLGESADASANEALGSFRRFPTWMWRNTDVEAFVEWLREHNLSRTDPEERVRIYGLDLYSLHASIEAVLAFLQGRDPEEAQRARERYDCFGVYVTDPQRYGYEALSDAARSCEDEVVAQLVDLRRRSAEGDEGFSAEQNARVVRAAERYYRTMYRGGVESWNLRDSHMMETLGAVADHVSGRVVVWAHNSHLGDARETEMGARGEHNLGQLVRERYPDDSLLVGFTTHTGTVTAASGWDAPAERKNVRPSLEGSWERLLHDTGDPVFGVLLDEGLSEERLERAIGVIYRPETERASHYFGARLGRQFDAVIHIDETSALVPLDPTSAWERGEAPETYPHAV